MYKNIRAKITVKFTKKSTVDFFYRKSPVIDEFFNMLVAFRLLEVYL